MKFQNKNVIITGGTTGIGFASAQAFLAEGANVWISGRNQENLDRAKERMASERLHTVVSDTSSLAGIEALGKAAEGINIDVLFLNAGIALFAPIAEATEAEFDAQFQTNVKGYFFTLQRLMPQLAEGAAVVMTSSTVATTAQMHGSIYAATKGAVNKIAQVAANELAHRKIRVNLLSPGPTQTEGFDKAVPNPEVKEYLAGTTALQRMGLAEEQARAVLFLASSEASFISGTELVVDGGFIPYALK